MFPAASASLDEHVDRVAVLGVHHHERARLGGDLHRPEERLVVDHQRALVGHEELVRGDALRGQRRELLERAAVDEVGDRDVEPVVDDRLALALLVPAGERLGERLALTLDAEVDVARRAAERRGGLPRGDVVDRDGAPERHVEMRVRVDRARKHELAGGVDHLVGGDVERGSDQRDRSPSMKTSATVESAAVTTRPPLISTDIVDSFGRLDKHGSGSQRAIRGRSRVVTCRLP